MEDNKLENVGTEETTEAAVVAEAAPAEVVVEEAPMIEPAVVEAPVTAEVTGEEKPGKKSKYQPVSALGFFGILLLASIPVIGWLAILIWALGGCRKVNKRSFARGVILKVVFDIIVIAACGIALKIMWDKSTYKKSVEEIVEVAQKIDFQKIGNIVNELDPSTLETLSKLQNINPDALNSLTQIAGNVTVNEDGNIDSASLITVIQNMQGVDMEAINKYLEDPVVKEIIENPEIMKELDKLEGLQDVVTVEDAKKLLEKVGDLSDIIGADNNNALLDFIKNFQ